MCKDILQVVVGSQLHGLAAIDSDIDLRGVFINDIEALVNPYEKPVDKRFIEGAGKDDTASELRKFVREVVEGNPNSIEVLFSNKVVKMDWRGEEMREQRTCFINRANVFNAYKNYSANQLNKMNLWTPDPRTPKFAVAYIRSLLNGVELLRDGTITNPVPDHFKLLSGEEIEAHGILCRIKFCHFEEFDTVRDEATALFAKLQVELGKVFYASYPTTEDRALIINFVRDAYFV